VVALGVDQLMKGRPDPGGGERVDVPDAMGVRSKQAHPPIVDARLGRLLDFWTIGAGEGRRIHL